MYQSGIASDYNNLLALLVAYLTGQGSAFGLAYSGAGNGSLQGYAGGASSVAETFSITALNPNQFSVTGSASGSLGTATVGAQFTTAQLQFTLAAGSTPFAAGDTFTLSTAPRWTATTSIDGGTLLTAPGNDGATPCHVGILPFSDDGGDYYNWQLGGFTGLDNTKAFAAQANANTGPILPLANTPIAYWFVANGRRVIIIARIGGVYMSAYLGMIQAYSTPVAYPMPLAVGGSLVFGPTQAPPTGSPSWRYSNSSPNCRAFALPGNSLSISNNPACSQLQLLKPDSVTWQGFDAGQENADFFSSAPISANLNGSVWPYAHGLFALHKNLDGSVPLLPIVLTDSTPNVYGRLDGVFATTGYQNQAEAVIANDVNRYLVVPNVFRAGVAEMFAVQLEGL